MPFRPLLRSTLRLWSRIGKAVGYHYQVVDRLGPRLAGRAPLASRLPNGCQIRCDLRDHVQRQQFFMGIYEPIESYLFTRLLRPGMMVVDAGANVGQYTLLAASGVGESGRVHAFEPVPSNLARIREAIEANGVGNARLNGAGLWDRRDTIRLGVASDEGSGMNEGTYSAFFSGSGGKFIEAPVLPLDEYVESEGIGRVDLIKMDIEGAEPGALDGARRTLERDRPPILMEVRRDTLTPAGESPESLARRLVPLGYRAFGLGLRAEWSGDLDDPASIDVANVIWHCEPLPAEVTSGWDLKGILRWARSGW